MPEEQIRETDGGRVMRGMKWVVEALRLEDFPMDRQAIDYSVGDIEVEDGRGGLVPVRLLTDQLRPGEFVSAEDVVRALRGVLKESAAKAA